jgi:hypothetical protein
MFLLNELGEKNYVLNIIGDGPLIVGLNGKHQNCQISCINVKVKGQVPRESVIRTLQNTRNYFYPAL